MRVYLPATSVGLQALLESGAIADPTTGFAVTPGLREWYIDDDIDELEYAAMLEAARASLRLLEGDPAAARRRVVIALEAPDGDVTVRDDLDRGVVRLNKPMPLSVVAAIHADDASAEAAVGEAAAAVHAADLGDPVAQDRVDDAEGFELSWFASQEIADLLADFTD
jgi:hypothetical protein